MVLESLVSFEITASAFVFAIRCWKIVISFTNSRSLLEIFFIGCRILINMSNRLLSDGGPPFLLCVFPVCLSTVTVSEFCNTLIIVLDF